MATPIVNVTQLPLMAESVAAQGGMQATVYNQAGQASRIPIEDLVGAGESLRTQSAVLRASVTIASADVLTLNATPVPFGIAVPTGFIPVIVGEVLFSATYGTATYAANVALRIRSVGGSVDVVSTANVLNFGASVLRNLDVQSSSTGIRYLDGTDLEVYVPTGNPTTGDSNVKVSITYMLIPTP